MNYCYYCEQLVDRMPYDGKQHWHDKCKQKILQTNLATKPLTNLADYWSKPPAEQQKLLEEVALTTPPSRCIVILDQSKQESEPHA